MTVAAKLKEPAATPSAHAAGSTGATGVVSDDDSDFSRDSPDDETSGDSSNDFSDDSSSDSTVVIATPHWRERSNEGFLTISWGQMADKMAVGRRVTRGQIHRPKRSKSVSVDDSKTTIGTVTEWDLEFAVVKWDREPDYGTGYQMHGGFYLLHVRPTLQEVSSRGAF